MYAEEDVQDFRQLRPGLDSPLVVVLFLCAERELLFTIQTYKMCCLSATFLEVNIEYAVSGNGDNVIGAKKYKLNLYFNPFKRADDQISIEQAAGEQSR